MEPHILLLMDRGCCQSACKLKKDSFVRSFYNLLAPRSYSIIVFGALFCTLVVKFFHSYRTALLSEYFRWILADIAVLLAVEVLLALVCFRWPRKLVVRIAAIIAAVVCTWSVMNAGWLIRTGTQILPTVLLPLIRDPLSALGMIGVNLIRMPKAAVALLGPSAVALMFFFLVLAKPVLPSYNRKRFINRVIVCVSVAVIAALARGIMPRRASIPIASVGLRYNCQLRAVMSFILPGYGRLSRADLANAKRKIPTFDQIQIALSPESKRINHNVVIVVLEGIQHRYTSLYDRESNLTPYLETLAAQGAMLTNARSSLTHTTKVLFGLLTARFASASQDLAEAVPVEKPYASIATILRDQLNFRTAFFQSAEGSFESRPGLVYNLGFDKFWTRDDLGDPNAFLGYLACDEFSMLEPIIEWIKSDEKPFLLTILCSVAHDPYVIPDWFGKPAKDPVQRYRQTISYTDEFIAALDTKLAELSLADKTILCVIGDHGEAFGEHGLLGHERIAFDEVLRIPWVVHAPSLIKPGTKVTEPVSSVDLTPTLLALLGFDVENANFDGVNAFGHLPDDRKVYFSGWMQQGPAGFIKGNRKFIYNPMDKMLSVYDLSTDPFETARMELSEQQAQKIADEIVSWRKSSIFRIDQQRAGEKMLFDRWLCRWKNRVSSAQFRPETKS